MVSREPIPRVTVRVNGTGRSTLANEDGQYRMVLEPGEWELTFTHVAHYSETVPFELTTSDVEQDIYLRPSIIELPGTTVYSRAYDPGQEIIIRAIARKENILNRLQDYQFDAYTKLVVRDMSDTGDVSSIFLLLESQTSAYWQKPDNYKEVITARRQSGNIPAEGNLVTVGEILNFNENRIDVGKYSVVSPTANDALDYYNYYLMDTLYIDSQAVFRLEIEPKSSVDPLFVGTIDIVDSTYDVVQVDVGFNDAARFEFLKKPHYSQRFALLEGEYWMPIEIRFNGEVHLAVGIPGIPKDLSFEHVASLYSYQFDSGIPPGIFNEYLIEVEPEADEVDSLTWKQRQTIPLTEDEVAAYQRIDSLEKLPEPFYKQALNGLAAALFLVTGGNEDLVHFNRVEGLYLGIGLTLKQLSPDLRVDLKTGYAFELKDWQYRFGGEYRLSERQKLWVGAWYQDKVVKAPTIISPVTYNPTFLALGWNIDPFDYYLQKGWQFRIRTKLLNYTRAEVEFEDVNQYSLPVSTDFALFKKDNEYLRENIHIRDGKLRAVRARLRFDSRKLLRIKGEDRPIGYTQYTIVLSGIEYSSPDVLSSDFDYVRYWVAFQRRQRMLGLGVTTLSAYAGGSDRTLPPQRYFTIDHGNGILQDEATFSTIDARSFSGSRAAVLYFYHDFDNSLLLKSRLPLIRKIPFTLSVHGGVFWTEFKQRSYEPNAASVAETPYAEAGFGVGNLTPFLMPFNLGLWFTWQISDYDTNDFAMRLGFAF